MLEGFPYNLHYIKNYIYNRYPRNLPKKPGFPCVKFNPSCFWPGKPFYRTGCNSLTGFTHSRVIRMV